MNHLRCGVVFWLVLSGGLTAGSITAQTSAPQTVNGDAAQLKRRGASDNRTQGAIVLDAIAKNKAGDPLKGLSAQDFALFDNKKRVSPTKLSFVEGAASEQKAQIIFVIDSMNSSSAELKKSEDAVEGFLQSRGGPLEIPTSILVVADTEPQSNLPSTAASKTSNMALHKRELFVHRIPVSNNGTFLIQSLREYKTGLHRILDTQGTLGQEERVRLSLEALSFIANAQLAIPGAKLVIWLSPGWPFLARSNAKSSGQLFNTVIYFSNLLRTARIILYAVSPEGVTPQDSSADTEGFLLNSRASSIQANGQAPGIPIELSGRYYAEFLKGVKDARQSNPNDLSLQVLAYQSGGLILDRNNDLEAMIKRCAADGEALYSLSYTPAAGSGRDVYHDLQVTLKRSSEPLRTRTGVYLK
jgi:VWFA-related protein